MTTENNVRQYISINLDPAKLPISVIAELLKGKPINLYANFNTNENPKAPIYTGIGISVWLKQK